MKIFVDDMSFPEAPVLLADGSFLFVEMGEEKGCVTWISEDGQSRRMVAKTGRPNGLARDRHGNIWVAETAQCALLKLGLEGGYEVFANDCDGEKKRISLIVRFQMIPRHTIEAPAADALPGDDFADDLGPHGVQNGREIE